jgi:gamma-glutamylcyclotransferase
MKYFAYGSNMCAGRLSRRVPSAQIFCIAKLSGHVFRFHKRSTDGSAKGDAQETHNPRDVVWGVVFDIADREKSDLDNVEGLGAGYFEKTVTVTDAAGNNHHASMYFADPAFIDATHQPYSWYKRFVIDGARQHALPVEYINALDALPAKEDSEQERDKRNRSIAC